MNRSTNKFIEKIFPVIISLFIGIYIGQHLLLSGSIGANNPLTQGQLDLHSFWDVWHTVSTNYIDARHIDKKQAGYGAIKGVVNSLGDPYSDYMDPDETRFFKSDLNSELEGIGAELIMSDGYLTIVSPLKGSPAEKSGLKPNDIIVEINGEDATELSLVEAITKIRGKKGTKVSLTIYRNGVQEPFVVSITRDIIYLESVTTRQLNNDIFYISINQFSNDTAKEFYNAVGESLLANSKGMILDLRYNGGGYVDIAVDILGEFLPKGSTAVIVETKADRKKDILKTSGAARLADLPLVILINEGSASASEILAGALQDYEKATLVGVKSYGKGTVQDVYTFDDESALRLTIAEWFTPLERGIDHVGLDPDINIELSDKDISEGKDTQLNAAEKYLNSL